MVSFTRCCRSSTTELPGKSRFLWVVVGVLLWLGVATTGRAQGIYIKSAELAPTESGYSLDATYDVALTSVLTEALTRGLGLTFVTEFELGSPRWWTFGLWNRTVSEFRTQQRLSFSALTRQYRLSFGAVNQTFDSLTEALAVVGRIHYAPAVRFQEVEPGKVYLAAVRLWLDTSQLPKPLQIDALGSSDWNLASDWFRWTFKP